MLATEERLMTHFAFFPASKRGDNEALSQVWCDRDLRDTYAFDYQQLTCLNMYVFDKLVSQFRFSPTYHAHMMFTLDLPGEKPHGMHTDRE